MTDAIVPAILSASGAFAGVIVAQIALIWTQRRQSQYSDLRFWQADRRKLYADFVSEINIEANRTRRAIFQNDPSMLPTLRTSRQQKLETLNNEIMLIGSGPVVSAAEMFYDSISLQLLEVNELLRLQEAAGERADLSKIKKNRREQQEEFITLSRVEFLRAARTELFSPAQMKTDRRFTLFPMADTSLLQGYPRVHGNKEFDQQRYEY